MRRTLTQGRTTSVESLLLTTTDIASAGARMRVSVRCVLTFTTHGRIALLSTDKSAAEHSPFIETSKRETIDRIDASRIPPSIHGHTPPAGSRVIARRYWQLKHRVTSGLSQAKLVSATLVVRIRRALSPHKKERYRCSLRRHTQPFGSDRNPPRDMYIGLQSRSQLSRHCPCCASA